MSCPRCRDSRDAGNRFCSDCGAAIEIACAACGTACEAGARFCGQCGVPLVAREAKRYTPRHLEESGLSSGSATGERKNVTVLFTDIARSMELAAQVDPEEWHEILSGFFEIFTQAVHSFEGTVNQYTGDGVMALFGAPVAHEHHAARACQAALRARQQLEPFRKGVARANGIDLAVRTGLNSGEVVVGRIGDDLRTDYTAQGVAVGMAARMEQLAEPGQILMTDRVVRAAGSRFEARALGEREVKGSAEKVAVYELVGERGASRAARSETGLIEREGEVLAMRRALDELGAGRGSIVAVEAPAGLGKTRLLAELAELAQAGEFHTHATSGLSYGQMTPLQPVLELMRSLLGLGDLRGQPARDRIVKRCDELGIVGRLEIALIQELLGVNDPAATTIRLDPEAKQDALAMALQRLVEADASELPSVLWIDDLQWLDAGSEGFLTSLLESARRSRILLVLAFRPEYRRRWSEHSDTTPLVLAPLSHRGSLALLEELLGAGPELAELRERLAKRAGGNPFFLEELVSALREAGSVEGPTGQHRLANTAGPVAVPDTIQAVITARIDRLGDAEKGLMQAAAVIGGRFSLDVLREVSELSADEVDAALVALQAASFIHVEAGGELVFDHPLVQETAYRSQLRETRGRIHERIAEAIAKLFPDSADLRGAAIAAHLAAAGRNLAAAKWYGRAAEAAGDNDPRSAAESWKRVRELLPPSTEDPELVALALDARTQLIWQGSRVGQSEEERDRLLHEGRALATTLGGPEHLAEFLILATSALTFAGRPQEAAALAREAGSSSDGAHDPSLWRATKANLALATAQVGNLADTIRLADLGLAVPAPSDRGRRGGIHSWAATDYCLLTAKGFALAPHGDPLGALECLQRAIAHAEAEDDLGWLASAHAHSVTAAALLGDADRAGRHADRAIAIQREVGSRAGAAMAEGAVGLAAMAAGDWATAAIHLVDALETARRAGTWLSFEGLHLAELAFTRLRLGQVARALGTAEEAVAVSAARGTGWFEIVGRIALAESIARTSGPKDERVLVQHAKAAERIEATGAHAYRPFLRRQVAATLHSRGDAAAAELEFQLAIRELESMGADAHIPDLKRLLRSAPSGADPRRRGS